MRQGAFSLAYDFFSFVNKPRIGKKGEPMDLEVQLHAAAMNWGADYFGIADLSPAHETILEQGGPEIAAYPRGISIGIALPHSIVDQLPRRSERAVAVSYRSHGYDVVNARLDEIASRLTSVMQRDGWRPFPVAASKRVDDERICGVFSHKLNAHLAGLGWIGKNCLLITPGLGPRVRWATVLTDAPLKPTGQAMDERCGDCAECVNICPMQAFTGQPFRAGEPRAVRFNAARCDQYLTRIRAKDDQRGVCGLCLYVCPHERR